MEVMDDFKELLRSKGLRATPGRIVLLKLLKTSSKPLAVRDMASRVKSLNQVTLYRALEDLADAGLVRRGVGPVLQYEYAAHPHHHHLVCLDCGFARQCVAC